ncbi:MAG: deoxynucleoside kinase [Candidatus Cloacimonadales bacterium]
MEHLRIGIVGNIGVGKSTLVEAASSEPLKQILLETIPNRPENATVHAFQEEFNPLVLDAFYQNPIDNAFMAQIEFFNGRLDRQLKIASCKGIVLEDRTLAEDYHIFGLAQKILGNMTDAEFLTYQRTYNLMTQKITEPDIIIYLKADVEILLARIAQRGRASETSIPAQYLAQLNQLYDQYIFRHVKCPVLVIDANKDTPLDAFLQDTIIKIAEEIRALNVRITTPGITEWVSMPETAAILKAIDTEKKLEQYLKAKPKLISVAGNVGLGKSTISAMMERSLNLQALYEKPENNPLLEKFLGNKKKYCYDLQLHFLKMRSALQSTGSSGLCSYVMDRSLPEDLLIFCYQFHQDGLLSKDELDILVTKFKAEAQKIPQADLLIILRGKPELAWQRILQRGREMEMSGGWSWKEIRALGKWYETYSSDIKRYGFHDGPVLEIDVERIDITNRVHLGYIFAAIHDTLLASEAKGDTK